MGLVESRTIAGLLENFVKVNSGVNSGYFLINNGWLKKKGSRGPSTRQTHDYDPSFEQNT